MTGAETLAPAASPPRRKAKAFIGVMVVAFLGGLAAAWYVPHYMPLRKAGSVPFDSSRIEQRLGALEQQVQALNARLNEVSEKPSPSENTGTPEGAALAPASALPRMQADLAALSSALSGLQEEVKRTGSAAAQTQKAAQASMALAIAFIQLRAAAEEGRGFASELTAMRAAAPEDAGLREILSRLEPYAAKGAPVAAMLREDFISRESAVTAAIRRSNAQNGWQRILAALNGLISIRPLHGGAMDACTAAEDALSSGDVAAALTATAELPDEARDALKDWRAKAEARLAVDTALHDLSGRFASRAAAPGEP